MTFDEWLNMQSIDIREDLDAWYARVGWNAARYHLMRDLESIDLLQRMQPLCNAQIGLQ